MMVHIMQHQKCGAKYGVHHAKIDKNVLLSLCIIFWQSKLNLVVQ